MAPNFRFKPKDWKQLKAGINIVTNSSRGRIQVHLEVRVNIQITRKESADSNSKENGFMHTPKSAPLIFLDFNKQL